MACGSVDPERTILATELCTHHGKKRSPQLISVDGFHVLRMPLRVNMGRSKGAEKWGGLSASPRSVSLSSCPVE